MFFTFRQNNSGGYFKGPKYVCVEASSAAEANIRAVDTGIVYFNGVRSRKDCECCGNRWYEVFEENGTVAPSEYGEPLATVAGDDHYMIVYADGRVEEKGGRV